VLLVLYVMLAGLYSLVTPVMEASDELWHYPMVKYIADHWSLPVQDPEKVGPWRQEGSQPPLYYWISALLTAWIDTSDVDQVRWLNPHVDNGMITEDGNTNLIIHSPGEGFVPRWPATGLYLGWTPMLPWRGTVLAIHLVRLLSVCMGAGTVYLTYLLALELWPERQGLALAAAAITAFNPMFCFISGAVNNDNLAMLLCALGIWLLVRLVRRYGGAQPVSRMRWWMDIAALGVTLGLGALTKSSAMGLLPLVVLVVGYVAWKRRSLWYLITGGLATAGLVVALSGWWFVRNMLLYAGDWTGIERFIVILGYRVPPATLRQLWGERHGFMMAYWGLFGAVNLPLPQWVYTVLNLSLGVALAGLCLGVVRWVTRRQAAGMRAASVCLSPFWVSLGLTLLWPLVVTALWAVWATRTWSSQGRLVFSAISAWSLWTALGISLLLPRRWSNWPLGALSLFMFAVAAWSPWAVIAPAYRPPILPLGVEPTPAHVLRADVGGQVRLLGYDVQGVSASGELLARPGGSVRLKLYWEAQTYMERNWSIFCHVLDRDLGLVIAVRDRYPGQGLLATSLMQPGLRWTDEYVIRLPDTAYAPAEAVLETGLYDLSSGERLPIVVQDGQGVQVVDRGLRFHAVHIEPRPGTLPNSTYLSFEDRMALVGWDVDRRLVAPGQALHLTLYWKCLAPMDRAYTVSAQVLSSSGVRVAQWDSWPGETDTADWAPGQQTVDQRVLEVAADAPLGGYDLILLVYDGQTLRRMRIINAQGRVLPSDLHVLGQVRVSP